MPHTGTKKTMKIRNAAISWLETGLPFSSKFGDVYYSRQDECAEGQHVFLAANKLERRWQLLSTTAGTFTIGELGFGSGLNFLQVWQAWCQATLRPAQLHYLAFEKYPLAAAALKRVHVRWPQLQRLCQQLQQVYPDHSGGCHRLCLSDHVILDLYYGDAYVQLQNRAGLDRTPVDAWFLDGFSPQLNPQLWEPGLFELLARSSNPHTTVSSYSVAGKVRKNLQSAGFVVEKLPGFGRKRHMLGARLADNYSATADAETRPWFALPGPANPSRDGNGRTALVIGAGLAGCSTAYSLARRGWQVTLCEGAAELASGASGNSQLALRCRLFKQASPVAEYFLHCFLFASRQFDLLAMSTDLLWRKCGVLQSPSAMNQRHKISDPDLDALYSPAVITSLSLADAAIAAGMTLSDSAWYLPGGGWLNPLSLCRAYVSHPNIHLRCSTPIASMSRARESWSAFDTDGMTVIDDAAVVVIANSYGAGQFQQTAAIPLQGIRGQVTEIAGNKHSEALKLVVSGERTVFPLHENSHTVSASYGGDVSNPEIEDVENLENIRLASALFENDQVLSSNVLQARTSVRCNSADHLPVVGPVADTTAIQSRFGALANNARTQFPSPTAKSKASAIHHPGLYINTAHASNGLASCPLSAEYLASLINGENLPISAAATEALNPVRFQIRNLKKQSLSQRRPRKISS